MRNEPESKIVKRVDYIAVPRDVCCEEVTSLPWSELRSMAERGERGMKILNVPEGSIMRDMLKDGLYWREPAMEKDKIAPILFVDKDVALFRSGSCAVTGDNNKSFLYGQNW